MMGEPNEFVDMSSLGSKVSSLQLAILNKKPTQKEASPFDTEMLQTKAAAHNRLRAMLVKDDMDGDDVTVYQSVAIGNDDHSLETTAFSSGGAIEEALKAAQQDQNTDTNDLGEKPKILTVKPAPKPKPVKQSIVQKHVSLPLIHVKTKAEIEAEEME